MKDLRIEIRNEAKEIHFSGNTFLVKDTIKSLGRALWLKEKKSWVIKDTSLSIAILKENFPSAEIIGTDIASTEIVEGQGSSHTPTSDLEDVAHQSAQTVIEGNSVQTVVSQVSGALSARFPAPIKIFGVVSSVKRYSGGRVYFDLRDSELPDVVLSCVIWESKNGALNKLEEKGFLFEQDLPVLLAVRVSLNAKRGQISLIVERFYPEYTLGKLQALREKTNERLRKEGLFDRNKMLKLPFLPRKLGILTSAGGTVINDFRASLDESKFGFELLWHPVRVQGDLAVQDILRGIAYLSSQEDVDAILLFRGGGSASELSLFSQYEIARAVCLCSKPVLCAIGHQEDQSSAQDVSFKNFGVPKDLGRFFADYIDDLRQRLAISVETSYLRSQNLVEDRSRSLKNIAYHVLAAYSKMLRGRTDAVLSLSSEVQRLGERLLQRGSGALSKVVQNLSIAARMRIDNSDRELFRLLSQLQLSSKRSLDTALKQDFVPECHRILTGFKLIANSKNEALRYLDQLFDSVSPKRQLERGFAIIKRRVGGRQETVTSLASLDAGQEIEVEMKDGIGIGTFLRAESKKE